MANEVIVTRDLPEITAGTVTVTNGSAIVTFAGAGTALQAVSGGVIYKAAGRGSRFIAVGREMSIKSVDSATQITLDEVWPGSTAPGVAYAIRTKLTNEAEILAAFTALATRGMLTNPFPDITLASGVTGFGMTYSLGSTLTGNKTFSHVTGDASRVWTMGGNLTHTAAVSITGAFTTAAAFTMSGAFAFTGTLTGTTGVTFPVTGTLATLAGTEALTGKSIRSGTTQQTVAPFQVRGNTGDQIEWGHNNQTIGPSTLGAGASNGQPFLAFNASASTDGLIKWKTWGTVGAVMRSKNNGTINFDRIVTASADNQSPSPMMTIELAAVLPGVDNTSTLGSASFRWTTVYATTGTINTSDVDDKYLLGEIDAALLLAALDTPLLAYQWNEARDRKGDGARVHFGPTAQGFRDACIKRGCDPRRFAGYCEDAIMITETRKRIETRQKTESVTVTKTKIELVKGQPMRVPIDIVETRGVYDRLPVMMGNGHPSIGKDGEPEFFDVPVMETVEMDYEIEIPSDRVIHGLRFDQFDRLLSHARWLHLTGKLEWSLT